MTSWLVLFSSKVNDYSTEMQMIDTIGPYNQWAATKTGAFSNKKGNFTNQTRHAVDEGGDWVLNHIDIDDDLKTATGDGTCGPNNAGDFPNGDLTWKVVHKI